MFGEDARVAEWAEKRIKNFAGWGSNPVSIGYEREGKLAGAVVYTNYSGANVFASIVMEAPITKRFLYSMFYNPFVAWGVNHITCAIDSSNIRSIKLCTRMGFVLRGLLPEAAHDGDVVIMGMLKRDCPWLGIGPKP